MVNRIFFVILLFLSASVSLAQSNINNSQPKEQNTTVQLGSVKLVIPTPDGFVNVSGYPSILEHFQSRVPAFNDLLVPYWPAEGVQKIISGESKDFDQFSNANVQIIKSLRENPTDKSYLAEVIAGTRKDGVKLLDINNPFMRKNIDDLEKKIAKQSKGTIEMDISGLEYLGEYDSTDNLFSMMLLSKMSITTGNEKKDAIVIGGASMILIKQRLLFVFIYKEFKTKEDIEILKAASRKWTSQIIEANKN